MSNSKRPDEVEQLEKRFLSEEKYTRNICHKYINDVYRLKIKFRHNDKELKSLDIILDIIKHKLERIRDIRESIVTVITTIFLPLGFLVGFFGMNFKSMGCPSLESGIYSIKNAELFVVIILGLSAILTILVLYYLKYKISI